MLLQYLGSLAGGPPASHTVRKGAQLILGSVFAGYTATAFPPEFLKLFEHPLLQFFIFFILFYQNYWNQQGFPKWYIMLDAALFTAFLQTSIYVTRKFYSKNESEVESYRQ